MNTFTVRGYVSEGGRCFDFIFDIFAESPVDATEKALQVHSSLVISSVCRVSSGRFLDY